MDMDGDPSFPELSIVMNGSSSCLDQSSFFRNGSVYNSSLPFMNSVMISGNRDTQEQAGITLDDFLESFVPVPPPVGDIYGTDGPDIFQDNVADHTIYGGAGQDTVSYLHRDGPVIVFLAGISAAPVLVGGRLEDLLFDVENIYGTPQDDILGGDGADNVFYGGPGINVLTGGGGADVFVFGFPGTGHVVTDFDHREGDLLDADTALPGIQRFGFSDTGAAAHAVWFSFDPRLGGTGAYADVDGDAGQPELSVFLSGVERLSKADVSQDTFVVSPLRRGSRELSFDGTEEDTITVDLGIAGYQAGTLQNPYRVSGPVDSSVAHVSAGAGNDHIIGDVQANVLSGGAGNDHLTGGPGRDVLTGGSGRDIFVYRDAADGGDVIADFSHDQGDCIDLSALDADILRDGRQSFTFSGCEPGSHAVWYESTEDGTGIYALADMDGDAKPDFFITLSGIYSLLLQDFIF